jgi:hypothetical protein
MPGDPRRAEAVSTSGFVVALELLHSKINLLWRSPLTPDRVIDFLSTHFTVHERARLPGAFVEISVHGPQDEPPNVRFDAGEEVWVRRSSTPAFSIPALRVVAGRVEWFQLCRSGTCMALDRERREARVWMATPEAWMDLVELIRDLVLRHEEKRGTVVLHAACAFKEGEATLIVGPKGAGKSTTLLDMVLHRGFQLLSGDKALLTIRDGSFRVSGWPDYPHLGAGTLSRYPRLVERWGLADQVFGPGDVWSPQRKVAIDPAVFRSTIPFVEPGTSCAIGRILYPEIDRDGGEMTLLTDHWTRLAASIERKLGPGSEPWSRFIEGDGRETEGPICELMALAAQVPAFLVSGCSRPVDAVGSLRWA